MVTAVDSGCHHCVPTRRGSHQRVGCRHERRCGAALIDLIGDTFYRVLPSSSLLVLSNILLSAALCDHFSYQYSRVPCIYSHAGIKVNELGATIHAYPSFSFALQQMCADVAVEDLFHGVSGRLIQLLKKV